MKIVAAIATTVFLWASAFVAIRHVGADVRPGALALGRLLVAAALLGVLVAAGGPRWPDRSAWPRLAICGVAWLGVYNVALNAAERRVDAGTAAMVVNLGPVLIAVLAGLFLGEGFPRTLLLGVATAFAGTVLIGVAAAGEARADPWGVVLCLVAAAGYAVGVVAQKPLLAGGDALTVTFLVTVVGAAACLPFAGQLVADVRDPATAAWVGYLGAGPTALAFTTWAYALARTDAGRLGATTYLVPPLVVVLAWVTLREVPAVLALVGGLLCLAGVAAARTKRLTPTRREGVELTAERG
ncbi:DMT family transporter [Asanoa sp. WMMD1127]|uniref:DMT family transporter n=1 Tax=Asanoa sp. WMMD1127 TaxID=3016107 RepID=UPI002416D20C|nr:DMT family transporter [Asanoa sp. WMMD1127]MDG4827294.1 DMT family transporter [Asanoa sp. WMMD1127]